MAQFRFTRFMITFGIAMAVAGCGEKKENEDLEVKKMAMAKNIGGVVINMKKEVTRKIQNNRFLKTSTNVEKKVSLCFDRFVDIIDLVADETTGWLDKNDWFGAQEDKILEHLPDFVDYLLPRLKDMMTKFVVNLQELVQMLEDQAIVQRILVELRPIPDKSHDPKIVSVTADEVRDTLNLVNLGLEFVNQIFNNEIDATPLQAFSKDLQSLWEPAVVEFRGHLKNFGQRIKTILDTIKVDPFKVDASMLEMPKVQALMEKMKEYSKELAILSHLFIDPKEEPCLPFGGCF